MMKKRVMSTILFVLGVSLANAALVHEWSFSETTGSTAADSIGANDGTATGIYDLNVDGPAVTFNGGSAYDTTTKGMTAGSDANFAGNPAFAISAWFNADTFTTVARILEVGDANGTKPGFALTAESGSGIGLRYGNGNLFWGAGGIDLVH